MRKMHAEVISAKMVFNTVRFGWDQQRVICIEKRRLKTEHLRRFCIKGADQEDSAEESEKEQSEGRRRSRKACVLESKCSRTTFLSSMFAGTVSPSWDALPSLAHLCNSCVSFMSKSSVTSSDPISTLALGLWPLHWGPPPLFRQHLLSVWCQEPSWFQAPVSWRRRTSSIGCSCPGPSPLSPATP